MPGSPLTVHEREQIFVCLTQDRTTSWVAIARLTGRHETTIAREVTIHGGRNHYSIVSAEASAQADRARPKPCRADDPELKTFAVPLLIAGNSPWAVACLAKQQGIQVCHETIYKIVDMRAWDTVNPIACLRSRRPRRKQRHSHPKPSAIGLDAPKITERCQAAATRTEHGHWEGDLIIGKGNKSAMITLVERLSGKAHTIVLPDGYTAEIVATKLSDWVESNPQAHIRTLTWDRGSEMAQWYTLTAQWNLPVYFCAPHSPWQRPVNENFNRQLRWWFPKGTPLNTITQAQADHACSILNNQPRRLHAGKSANERYDQSCTDQ